MAFFTDTELENMYNKDVAKAHLKCEKAAEDEPPPNLIIFQEALTVVLAKRIQRGRGKIRTTTARPTTARARVAGRRGRQKS